MPPSPAFGGLRFPAFVGPSRTVRWNSSDQWRLVPRGRDTAQADIRAFDPSSESSFMSLFRSKRILRLLIFSTIACALSARASTSSFLDPTGPVAHTRRQLFFDIIYLMLIVVVPVLLLVPLLAWRYRRGNRSAQYRPEWTFSRPLEILIWGSPRFASAPVRLRRHMADLRVSNRKAQTALLGPLYETINRPNRPRAAPPNAGLLRVARKSLGLRECVVAHAVTVELVSIRKFPANRENSREFCEIRRS
jgi:hypothetical protein